MTIHEFQDEYDNLTPARQKEGLQNLFNILVRDHATYDGVIQDILSICVNEEDYDYFGSEGMDI